MIRLFIFCCLIGFNSYTQTDELQTELGLDGFLSFSSFGGSGGIGARYGFIVKEDLIVGPMVRYQRYWSNNLGTNQTYGFNAYGVGGFIHKRIGNILFLGAELEFMRSPISTYGTINGSGQVTTACFAGGGYSQEFSSGIRINAGLFYDLVNNPNSPFRNGYFMKRTNGSYIPAIYRICFFFPL